MYRGTTVLFNDGRAFIPDDFLLVAMQEHNSAIIDFILSNDHCPEFSPIVLKQIIDLIAKHPMQVYDYILASDCLIAGIKKPLTYNLLAKLLSAQDGSLALRMLAQLPHHATSTMMNGKCVQALCAYFASLSIDAPYTQVERSFYAQIYASAETDSSKVQFYKYIESLLVNQIQAQYPLISPLDSLLHLLSRFYNAGYKLQYNKLAKYAIDALNWCRGGCFGVITQIIILHMRANGYQEHNYKLINKFMLSATLDYVIHTHDLKDVLLCLAHLPDISSILCYMQKNNLYVDDNDLLDMPFAYSNIFYLLQKVPMREISAKNLAGLLLRLGSDKDIIALLVARGYLHNANIDEVFSILADSLAAPSNLVDLCVQRCKIELLPNIAHVMGVIFLRVAINSYYPQLKRQISVLGLEKLDATLRASLIMYTKDRDLILAVLNDTIDLSSRADLLCRAIADLSENKSNQADFALLAELLAEFKLLNIDNKFVVNIFRNKAIKVSFVHKMLPMYDFRIENICTIVCDLKQDDEYEHLVALAYTLNFYDDKQALGLEPLKNIIENLLQDLELDVTTQDLFAISVVKDYKRALKLLDSIETQELNQNLFLNYLANDHSVQSINNMCKIFPDIAISIDLLYLHPYHQTEHYNDLICSDNLWFYTQGHLARTAHTSLLFAKIFRGQAVPETGYSCALWFEYMQDYATDFRAALNTLGQVKELVLSSKSTWLGKDINTYTLPEFLFAGNTNVPRPR